MTENANTNKEVTEPKDPNAFSVASDKSKTREIELTYDFGKTLDDSAEKFGAEVVHSYWLRGAKVAVQGLIRKMLVDNKSDEEIEAALEAWVPGVKAKRSGGGRKKKSIEEMFQDASPEEQKRILESLRASLAQ